jgi:hypothetical protein
LRSQGGVKTSVIVTTRSRESAGLRIADNSDSQPLPQRCRIVRWSSIIRQLGLAQRGARCASAARACAGGTRQALTTPRASSRHARPQ